MDSIIAMNNAILLYSNDYFVVLSYGHMTI